MKQAGDSPVPGCRYSLICVRGVFAAQAQRGLTCDFEVLEQVGHGGRVKLLPGLLPARDIATQGDDMHLETEQDPQDY